MNDDTKRRTPLRLARPAGFAIAGVLAGAIASSAFAASAQTPAPSTSNSVQAPSPSSSASPKADSSEPVRDDESLLTGTTADKARAAALKAVPGGTIVRLETDSGPAEYEAHMRKADGTPVTVLMDANFAVTSVVEGKEGRGARGGGRHGGGRHGGDGECDEDADGTSPSGSATPSAATASA